MRYVRRKWPVSAPPELLSFVPRAGIEPASTASETVVLSTVLTREKELAGGVSATRFSSRALPILRLLSLPA